MCAERFDFNLSLFDGTFIWRRKIEAVILLDAERHQMVKGEYGLRENLPFALFNFFAKLRSAGLSPKSATVDGNSTVIRALKVIGLTLLFSVVWCIFRGKG